MNRLEEMVADLLYWYRYHARVLPWREDPSAYHVWVSEIMLQQTRVEAVRGYYDRFLRELPTVRDLAECPEDKLLKLWEGLGYYSRVRNLQKAARVICEQYDGRIPDTVDELKKLPGIGEYTAGAIASIAFSKAEPAVDGNFLRVISRIEGSREDIADPAVKERMTSKLRTIMPETESGILNQAVMDIGATICIPNGEPRCEECPLQHLCVAFHEDLTGQIPVKTAKKPRKIEEKTVYIVRFGEYLVLHKRSEKGLLAGMWEYPNIEKFDGSREEYAKRLAMLLKIPIDAVDEIRVLPKAKHIFTHIEWHMNVLQAEITEAPSEEFVLATPEEMVGKYSLPSAFGKLTK